jgi:hypothetical protein
VAGARKQPRQEEKRPSLLRRLLPLSVWQSIAATVIAAAIIGIGATIAGYMPFVNGEGQTTESSLPTTTATPEPIEGGIPARAWHRGGTPTFASYHDGSVAGPTIGFKQTVKVSCKVKDTTVPSANPDGYWYRIKSPPWSDRYYAIANTFLNGDPPDGPYTRNTDFRIPDC